MSSEPPPNPITNTFNLRAWIQDVTSSSGAYISKLVADTAAGVITFTSGIKTNLIEGAGTSSTQVKIFPNSSNAIIDIGPQFPIVGESSLIRFGPGGACNVAMGFTSSILTAQNLNSFNTGTVSLYNTYDLPISMGSTSTAIQIGTSQASTNTIGIGASGSIVTLPGANTLGSIACAAINSTAAGTTMNIASTSTGIVTLAAGASRTGVLNLGDGNNSSGAVHINNGVSSSGNVRIMNGSGQSGDLTLGGTSNTVVIEVNRPLTLGYAPAALASSNMLGFTTTDEITLTGTIPNGALTSIFSALTLPVGVWLITYSVRYRSAGTSTITAYYIWGQDSITGQDPPKALNATNTTFITNGDGFANTGTFVVSSTGTTTYVVRLYMAYSGSDMRIDLGTPDFGSEITRTRIA
jgi:hypothetical protein